MPVERREFRWFVARQTRIDICKKYVVSIEPQIFLLELEQTAGVTLPEPFRSNLISQMQGGTLTAAQVLRQFIEHSVVFNKFFNRGFVSLLYFGLLHRNPDTIGFNNWLNQLNATGDQRPIVFGFIYSTEYRSRFGP